MSFSFSVPAGPASDFAAAAAAAKSQLQSTSEGNDYMLTQYASDTCDAAIKAASDLVNALGDGSGTASGSIAGHHANDGVSACTASASVSVTPAPKVEASTDAPAAPSA